MKLYIVSEDPQIDADVVIHTGRTITIRGRGKTRLPDCSDIEFVKQFYRKLPRYGLKLKIDMTEEVKPQAPATAEAPAPDTPAPEPVKENVPEAPAKEEVPPEAPAKEPEEIKPAGEVVEGKPLDRSDLMKMTKPQLLDKAKEMGLGDLSALSKSALVDRILG